MYIWYIPSLPIPDSAKIYTCRRKETAFKKISHNTPGSSIKDPFALASLAISRELCDLVLEATQRFYFLPDLEVFRIPIYQSLTSPKLLPKGQYLDLE